MTNYTSLINFNFGGIRRKDSMFSADKITCSDCQNVDLYYTKLNSGVGIRTTKGNISVTKYEDEEMVIAKSLLKPFFMSQDMLCKKKSQIFLIAN